MKKDIHMQMNDVIFICASCGSKYQIKSTLKSKETTVDVCSSCHPFYVGISTGQQVKGRAEKFNKKIVDQQHMASKKEAKSSNKKQSKKIVKSLNNL